MRSRSQGEAGKAKATKDAGFTLVEMLIALLVFAIIVPVALGAIRNLTEQSVVVNDLVGSMEQDQTAGQSLLQYLHGATDVSSSSTASSLSAEINLGYDQTTGVPGTATLDATCTPTSTTDVGRLVITLQPSGAASPTSTRSFYVETPTTTSPTPCGLFRYGDAASASFGWTGTASADTVAVGVSATLLAGTTIPPEGAAARPSTLETEVYLQNVATTTTTTVAP